MDANLKYAPEYVPEYNLTIYRVPMKVGEAISPNADDDGYTAYVAEDAEGYQAVLEALHAKEHADDSDFQKASVQQIEAKAHGLPTINEEEIKAALKAEEERKKRIAKAKAYLDAERKKLRKEIRALKKIVKQNEERDAWLEEQGYNLEQMTINRHEWNKLNPY